MIINHSVTLTTADLTNLLRDKLNMPPGTVVNLSLDADGRTNTSINGITVKWSTNPDIEGEAVT